MGTLVHLYHHLSSILLGMPELGARQPSHSDDGDHRALAWIELYRLHLGFVPLLGLPEFLSSVKDGFGPRGNSGRTRSSAV